MIKMRMRIDTRFSYVSQMANLSSLSSMAQATFCQPSPGWVTSGLLKWRNDDESDENELANFRPIAESAANSAIAKGVLLQNRQQKDLTTAATVEKRLIWRNHSPCLLRRRVAQQQLRENCCGKGKDSKTCRLQSKRQNKTPDPLAIVPL
jgi:hypothetical protein